MLAIAKQGALTDLLELTGAGVWADPDDPSAISEGLLQVMRMSRNSNFVVRSQLSQFHYKTLTGRLAEMIKNISAPPSAEAPEALHG